MKIRWLLLAIPCMAASAIADQTDPVRALTVELKDHVPKQWQIHVRWREKQLFASITPWPYQEAFDLWYDTSRLAETMTPLSLPRTEKALSAADIPISRNVSFHFRMLRFERQTVNHATAQAAI